MGKRLLTLCLLLFHLALPAFALEQTGSIRLTLPGGNLWLYQVATLSESGNLQLTEDFSSWEGPLTELSSPETAQNLANFAVKNHCSGIMETVKNDKICFDHLEAGLYLLLQTEAASGYEPIAPFLVVLPKQGENDQSWEIDGTPKIQLTTTPTQPLPSLPQTGQQKLPVLILGISGLLLFLVGLALQRRFHG